MNVAFETNKLPNLLVQVHGSNRLGLDFELPRFPAVRIKP